MNRQYTWLALAGAYLALQPLWDIFLGRLERQGGRLASHLGRLEMGALLVYLLGVPYAALLTGTADARQLGLASPSGWSALAVGAGVGVAGSLMLAWTWGRASRVSYQHNSRRRALFSEWQALHTPWGWVPLLLQVLCLQSSWAFVRGAAVSALGLYEGVFVGLALSGLAWLLRPGRRTNLLDPDTRPSDLLLVGLALVTALVYLYSESLWLCTTVHVVGLLAATAAAGRAYAEANA